MDHPTRVVATLAQDLVRIDSRSSVSNLELAGRLERELTSFEVERIPYVDDEGIEKVVLVATRGRGGIAFSGHMDTVPDTGWLTDPWSGRIEEDELFGLGATDMKGPVAALVVAAQSMPGRIPHRPGPHHRRGDHQGRRPRRGRQRAAAPLRSQRHRHRRAHRPDPGPRPPRAYRVHRHLHRAAGAQQHRPRPATRTGT